MKQQVIIWTEVDQFNVNCRHQRPIGYKSGICVYIMDKKNKSQQSAGWYYLCVAQNRASRIVDLVFEITVMSHERHCVSYGRQQSTLKILDVQIIGLLWGEQPVTGGVPPTTGHLRGNRFNGLISSCGGYVLYHYVENFKAWSHCQNSGKYLQIPRTIFFSNVFFDMCFSISNKLILCRFLRYVHIKLKK